MKKKQAIKYLAGAAISLLFLGGLVACGESYTPDSSSGSVTLSSPQNVYLSLDWTGLKTDYILTWDNVENAEGYKITVGENFFETSEQSYNLSSVLTVDKTYEIGIQTVGDGEKYGNSETVTIEEEIKSVSNKIIYEELEDGTYEVSKNIKSTIKGELVLPDTYKGEKITQIAKNGFEEPYQEETFQPGVGTAVNGITTVRFPRYLTTISDFAFSYCMSLKNVEIPESVTNFGTAVFSDCENLVAVHLSENITVIPENTFNRCKKLKSVEIPKNITTIETTAFYASGIENIKLPDGLSLIKTGAFDSTALTQVKIPASVEIIESSAFSYCDKLQEVEFEENSRLTTIGNYTFLNTAITELTIPASVTDIGYGICYTIENPYINNDLVNVLERITVEEGNTAYKSINGDLYTIDESLLVQYAGGKKTTEFIIPTYTTTIGKMAFAGAIYLKAITIPDSVTTIKESAFWGATSLKSITIPESVVWIETGAFSYCTALEYVKLPQTRIEIASNVFSGCDSLKLLRISSETRVVFQNMDCACVEFMEGVTAITKKWGIHSFIVPKSVTEIGNLYDDGFFGLDLNPAITVYYKGTAEEWEAIECEDIGTTDVTIYYYSENEPPLNEDETAYDGNYWYYGDDGVPVIWNLEETNRE